MSGAEIRRMTLYSSCLVADVKVGYVHLAQCEDTVKIAWTCV